MKKFQTESIKKYHLKLSIFSKPKLDNLLTHRFPSPKSITYLKHTIIIK